jgi:salicylate hydroxylase
MTIKVAIVGGSVAGLCLAKALLQYPQFDVHVYEQVRRHHDKGGALTLHHNAIGAMELIDPAIKLAYFRKANDMLEDDEKEMATHVIMAEGKHMGETIAKLGKAKGRKTVARLDLVEGLQELIPNGIVKMGRRVVNVEEVLDGQIELTFRDGSTAIADCLVGADGVHSVVRQHVLGKHHPAASPVNHDKWYRVGCRIPADALKKSVSEDFLGSVSLICGPDGMVVLSPIHFGKTFSVGVVKKALKEDEIGEIPDPREFARYHPDVETLVQVSALSGHTNKFSPIIVSG